MGIHINHLLDLFGDCAIYSQSTVCVLSIQYTLHPTWLTYLRLQDNIGCCQGPLATYLKSQRGLSIADLATLA